MLRVLFFGTPEFACRSLASLVSSPEISVGCVVAQPDRPAGRGNAIRPPPTKVFALEHSIPVIQPGRIRKSEDDFIESVRPFGPFHIGVVVAFGQILPRSVLDLPRAGCVNVHASLLPRWRGAAPIQRSLMAGDTKTGVCLMGMEEGLDTGPVFSSSELSIGKDETAGELHDRLAVLGGELLLRDLRDIADGSLGSHPQPDEGVTIADKISNEEAQINWGVPAVEVHNRIRGLSPFPGAYTFVSGKRLRILGSSLLDKKSSEAPGTIIEVNSEGFIVNTTSGGVLAREVQLEGKRRMSTNEFLRGMRLERGLVLGS